QLANDAAPRTVSDKLSSVVHLRDYGAVGDGVSDDTAAVQTAFFRAAAEGKVLEGEFGNYRCTSTILIPSYTRYRGAGATFIKDWEGGGYTGALFRNEHYSTVEGDEDITLENL